MVVMARGERGGDGTPNLPQSRDVSLFFLHRMQRSFSAPVGVVDPYLQRSFSAPVGLVDPYLQRSFSASVGPADPSDPLDVSLAPTAAHAPFWERRARVRAARAAARAAGLHGLRAALAPAAWGRTRDAGARRHAETPARRADARARDGRARRPERPRSAAPRTASRARRARPPRSARRRAARPTARRRRGGGRRPRAVPRELLALGVRRVVRETLGVAEVCRRARDPRRIRGRSSGPPSAGCTPARPQVEDLLELTDATPRASAAPGPPPGPTACAPDRAQAAAARRCARPRPRRATSATR